MTALSVVIAQENTVRQRVSAEEWEVRVKLAAAYR
ncbi:MAG: class II aldolase/adducin family protein, partial [Pseudomonas putida]